MHDGIRRYAVLMMREQDELPQWERENMLEPYDGLMADMEELGTCPAHGVLRRSPAVAGNPAVARGTADASDGGKARASA